MPVTVFLTNGSQFRGVIRGFDHEVLVLDCDGMQNLIYQHAVSSVVPSRRFSLPEEGKREENA